LLFFLTAGLIIISGCKNEDEESANKIITGTVIDQVSKQPVALASVRLGSSLLGDGVIIGNSEYFTESDHEGKYKLVVPESFYNQVELKPLLVYAHKDGFAGSSYCHITVSNTTPIELYHCARLILRIWNDTTTNNIDECQFGLVGNMWSLYPGYIGRSVTMSPLIEINCSGRKFDKVYEWYPLWGNLTYSIDLYPFSLQIHSTSFKAIPDSTTYCTVTF